MIAYIICTACGYSFLKDTLDKSILYPCKCEKCVEPEGTQEDA